MVSKEHSLQDLDKVAETSQGDLGKLLIGIAKVIVTMLVSIRSNQMLTDADKVRIRAEREKKFKSQAPQKEN